MSLELGWYSLGALTERGLLEREEALCLREQLADGSQDAADFLVRKLKDSLGKYVRQ